ncbi:hypothetical protein [Sinorhizobium meliloti]|nr:hypothetical protein [Sinorhizobium meliloti]TWB03267.1 hypothetical protein FB000_104126 [Ensifer sp. SEMIA 134]TWB39414.1 hypothetical protein FB001_103202 [Ensifer sp. SEMIA 135]AEG04515.1 hypothetical protein SinmeB_1601 [Sinorhizobium meliloti BL225C]AEG53490.1 hypothetical protein Sinme_1756 [Sinorhizobium meliloti AK83]AGA06834.1 hypothetical protein C770_GR4Chr1906 [Sinorhizobium meliloti GR4]
MPPAQEWGHAQQMQRVAEKGSSEQQVPTGLTVGDLVRNPNFPQILQAGARTLIALNDLFPRVARLVASHQKWMLTQAAYSLHLERDVNNPESGITAARLLKFMRDTGGASRNTAAAFLAELVAYKMLQPASGGRTKRARPLEPTEVSETAMRLWFKSQMSTIDLLDGGTRVERVEADKSIFERAQPLAARRLLSDSRWTTPPKGVAIFVWSESGGVILDDLMTRVSEFAPMDGKVWVEVSLAKLAEHYLISNTHVRRIFARADAAGFLGKSEDGRRGRFWLSARLIEEYVSWQAVKIEALASAYDQASDWAA